MDVRKIRDIIGTKLMLITTLFIVFLFFLILFTLISGSLYIIEDQSITKILFSSSWKPRSGDFGLLGVIIGTIIVTGIAMIIAVPISLLTAIYIVEYSPKKVRQIIRPFIDLLAGVPSVVYGLCAFIVFVPLVRDVIAPFFGEVNSSGFSVFTASLILSIMVFPIIISLCIESFNAIPIELKEASLSVGATKWETVKKVIFRAAGPGILSAILLGFGRAFGETIAVSMVIGNQEKIPSSLFSQGQTLASIIAQNYIDVMSLPRLESALIFVGLILFFVVLIFNLLGFFALRKARSRWDY
ncbi:MAG: phosphate ABC transporter permease subunit PstC [Candidatus Thermoplasmatota archaeon]|jgi:phosphate transport system permease protein|nr:phosphate ABC transporter permease subunit PstC [Candidatus Thermoplasmatota archaeon]